MTKVPSWRAKAMYMMFAFALVFGLAAAVITAAPSAEASIPNSGSFLISGGSYQLTPSGEMMGYFTGTNTGMDIGPYYAEMTYNVTVTGSGPNAGLDTSGEFMAQAVVSANPDRIDFYGQYGGGIDVTLVPRSGGTITITQAPDGTKGVFAMDYTDDDDNSTDVWVWEKGGYIGVPELIPGLGQDVMGSQQKFVLVNVPLWDGDPVFSNHVGLIEQELEKEIDYHGLPFVLDWVQGDLHYAPGIDEWIITSGVALSVSDIVIAGGGNVSNNEPWIEVETDDTGDAHFAVRLQWVVPNGEGLEWAPYDVEKVEKKWGIIHHTVLDMHPEVPERPASPQASWVGDAGTSANPRTQNMSDYAYASFYWGSIDNPEVYTAGDAVVHWYLIKDDIDHENRQAILDIMDLFNEKAGQECAGTDPCGCGPYDRPDQNSIPVVLTPQERIEAVYNGAGVRLNEAQKTKFTNVVDGYYYEQNDDTYLEANSQGDFPGEDRGLTMVEVANTGEESILVVTLTEYPTDFHGEQPVCIEMGYKSYSEAPPPSMRKTPQVRWAGDPIILEQDFSKFVEDGEDYIATFHLERQSVGELSGVSETRYKETSEGDIWVWVDSGDPIPECMLETEVQGEADINFKLYIASNDSRESDPETWEPKGSAIVPYGFLVYFLAIEDVTLADSELGALADITTERSLMRLPVDDDAPVAVQVRGWFTSSDELAGTTREAVDVDLDGINEMPAGRYVLPDDWSALANHNYDFRPNYDLMDQAHLDDIGSTYKDGELGPFNSGDVKTTTPPGKAMNPTIGPFNTLQIWNSALLWEATATVPADMTVAVPKTSKTTADVRNTVVPDGELNAWDCPMPPALVDFRIKDWTNVDQKDIGLSTLDKGTLEGYGNNSAGYPSPFYRMEIPSHTAISAIGYAWNSWGSDTTRNGPYDMWTDLKVFDVSGSVGGDESSDLTKDLDVEVYSDNHGIAGVTADAIDETGSITIWATADYPALLKMGKYGPVKSEPISVEWGLNNFNPDFEGDPQVCDGAGSELCTVTFTNYTRGGTKPYDSALWSFGDGSAPVYGAVDYGKKITHVYQDEGIYTIRLTMVDYDGQEAYQVQPDYIEVGTNVTYPTRTWSFDEAGCFGKHLPESYLGTVNLMDYDDPAPLGVLGVFQWDDGRWKFWSPGIGGTDLSVMVGDLDADYTICVDRQTDWEITLTP